MQPKITFDGNFGFSFGNFHFENAYKGEIKILMGMNQIFK